MEDVDKSVKKVLESGERPKGEQAQQPQATLDSSKENAEDTDKTGKSAQKKELPLKEEEQQQKPAGDLKYNKQDFTEASNGKEWNFKIASWNINGVRAWIEVSPSLSRADSLPLNCLL